MNLREKELLNEQFSYAAKLCVNSKRFFPPHFPLVFFSLPTMISLVTFQTQVHYWGLNIVMHSSPMKVPLPVLMCYRKAGALLSILKAFELPSNPNTFYTCIITTALMCSWNNSWVRKSQLDRNNQGALGEENPYTNLNPSHNWKPILLLLPFILITWNSITSQ